MVKNNCFLYVLLCLVLLQNKVEPTTTTLFGSAPSQLLQYLHCLSLRVARHLLRKKPNLVQKKAKLLKTMKFWPFPCVTMFSPRWSTKWIALWQIMLTAIWNSATFSASL